MLRRGFLKALGAAPLAAPAIATELYTEVGQRVAGGSALQGATYPNQFPPQQTAPSTAPDRIWPWLRNNPQFIAELRDEIASEVHVTYIAPDLLAMRSLSQAARIYYMRQRLIEERLAVQLKPDCYDGGIHGVFIRWRTIAAKALGIEW